jgi:predicted acylesterase/phospholipase RssA
LSDRKHPISIDGIEHRPLLEDGEFLSEEAILEQTHDWSDSDRVLVDLDVTNDLVGVTNVVKNCDQVFWCLEPDQSELAAAHLTEIERHAPASREKISIAWLLKGDDEVVPLTPRLRALSSEDYKLSLEEPGPTVGRALTNGFERVIHQLRGIRIGVALGGGAARGMAHLGVLKALEESGIVVDMIAGSSAGAMTGTLMAAGLDAGEITESFVRDLEPPWLFRILPRGSHWYLLYKYRTGRFDPMLRVYLKHRQLEQLPIPMSSIAVDLISGDVVVRDDGDAVHSVIDSINLPILSAPICRQGRVLVDGGLVNNIPADVLVGKGCNFVIAVSVTAELGDEFGGNRASTPTKEMKTPSTLQTILRSYLLQSRNNSSVGVELADVVIEPDVTMFDISEFTRADELAAIGEQTTVEAVPRIKELLAQLDSEMFSGNGAQSRTDSESRPSTGEAILDHDLAQR